MGYDPLIDALKNNGGELIIEWESGLKFLVNQIHFSRQIMV